MKSTPQAIKTTFRKDINTAAKRLLLINGYKEGEYNPHHVKAFAICNEFGHRCIAIGSYEQEALDNAVNENLLDSELMSEEDHTEYDQNGWHDSFIYAGNASEPFWCEYMQILPVEELTV